MARNTSSSTTGPRWNNDVFVSFREDDKVETFIVNLFKRLHQVGIGAEKIEDNCPNALHEPTFAFALVVLSKNYVDSYPCRLQLVKILDCKRVHNLEVIPIFYMEREKVLNLARCDELEPGHRKALEEAEEMPGCDLKAANGERNLIDKIVGRLVNRIYSRYNEKFTFGPFGGEQNSRKPFKTKLIEEISEKGIKVEYGDFIKSVKFEVDKNTDMIPKHGEKHGYRTYEVKLEDDEKITSFAGSQKKASGKYFLISSLTFRTNKRILGPIGRVKEEEEVEEEKIEEKGKKDKSQGRKEEDEERRKKEEAEKKKKREKREREEEEGYFSVPLDAGEVTEFYWREEGEFLDSVGALIQLHPKGFNPFPSVGLFGRKCDREPMWKHTNVRKIVIHIGQKEEDKPDSSAAQKKKKEPSAKTKENRLSGGPFIRSIEFTCEDGGKPETHGSETGLDTKNFLTIELDNGEYLTSISGYYTDHISGRYSDFGITSLTFRTNKRMAITIGEEKGIYFSSPAMAGKITGFYGYIDEHQNLCGIGAYFEPISDQGQFGAWDDGKFDGVREIYLPDKHTIRSFTFVYDNGSGEDRKVTHPAGFSPNTKEKVNLGYPREYLTSISGYKRKNGPIGPILSLTFHSNKQRIPPYGKEGGLYFWYPLAGSRIVGFYGSEALDYVGVHVKPIPHLYPFRTVGSPMKGSGGVSWDDGVHTDVRGYRVSTGLDDKKEKIIKSITFIYDNNGFLVKGDQHGGGDASTEDWVLLNFPKVRLLRIEGYMRREGNRTIIHDLTMVPTEGAPLPFASGKDKKSSMPFVIPEGDARIVGLFGTAGTYLNSIGARLEPY